MVMLSGVAESRNPLEELCRFRFLVYRGLTVLLIVLVLLTASWISMLAYGADWAVREVYEVTVSCCPAISKTPAGDPLSVFGTSSGLVFASENDGSWSLSTIMESGDIEGSFSVLEAAITVDSAGNVHVASVSYWPGLEQPGTTKLVYSRLSSSGWENTMVDVDIWSSSKVSIAVGVDSGVHISYAKSSGWSLVNNITYATDATGEWRIYDISGQLPYKWQYGVWSSICVDSAGTPHIAWLSGYGAGCATNLSGTLSYVVISRGNPGMSGVYPSRPSMAVDSDGDVHVLCVHEAQDSHDGPIARTLVHYIVGGARYENRTISSDVDISYDTTFTVMDEGGRLLVFYNDYGHRSLGVLAVDGSSDVRTTTIHVKDPGVDSAWTDGVSAVLGRNGKSIVSKPYGFFGYLTDTPTLSERLSTATAAIDSSLIALVLIIVGVSVLVILSRRLYLEVDKWHKALEE